MSCAPLFDLERLPAADRERYGKGAFAQHALQARHLIENGSTFVMVANGMPWDNHVYQHEMHQMLVPELDNVFYQLITDLEQRGMLQDTLVIAMGEFGRTPWLNDARGRDHYSKAWSMAMAGGGIRGGVCMARPMRWALRWLTRRSTIVSCLPRSFSRWGSILRKNTTCPTCRPFIVSKAKCNRSQNCSFDRIRHWSQVIRSHASQNIPANDRLQGAYGSLGCVTV